MPTSMLDALVHEQNEIVKLGAEASRLAIEALRRSNLLRIQLEFMAGEERISAPICERVNSEKGNAPVIQESPEFRPQAQDSEEGNNGSGVVAPGVARGRLVAEPEQAVADAASEERIVAVRNDPEAGPDATVSPLDAVLNLYVLPEALGVDEIARRAGITRFAVAIQIRSGRASGDSRAAAGDLLRHGDETDRRRKPKSKFLRRLAEDEPNLPRAKQSGEILLLDLKDCKATFDEETIQLVRWELRLLVLLNSGLPAALDEALKICGYRTGARFDLDVGKLNARLIEIGVQVIGLVGNFYQLRAIEPVS
jgi:hypothetical protein